MLRTDPSDAVLAAAVAQGDLAALGKLYDIHHAAVRRFARRLVDEANAEDLLHDTFLTLPTALARWSGEGALRTFIMGVAINHAQHRVRSRSRFGSAITRLGREPERVEHDPEQRSEQKQLAERLRRALETLSFEHRTAFVLCEIEERTSVEVAEILAVPEGTVRTRLHYAKQKLRAALGPNPLTATDERTRARSGTVACHESRDLQHQRDPAATAEPAGVAA